MDTESSQPVAGIQASTLFLCRSLLFRGGLIGDRWQRFFSPCRILTGNPELTITEAADSCLNHSILLASEFCNKPVSLPFVPLLIDSAEQSIVREILVNMQLMERYGIDARTSGGKQGW